MIVTVVALPLPAAKVTVQEAVPLPVAERMQVVGLIDWPEQLARPQDSVQLAVPLGAMGVPGDPSATVAVQVVVR